jgi:hypothetical protein
VSEPIPLTRRERLAIFFERLRAAEPASNHDAALELLATTLQSVEDEFSGVAYNPDEPGTDGRMYPPETQFRYVAWEKAEVRCYRQTAHASFIGMNGAVEIRTRRGSDLGIIVFEKAGKDGKKVTEDDAPG